MFLKTFGKAGLLRAEDGPVRDDGEAADLLLPLGKPLALLIYLAAAPRKTATRDELVDLLWANSEPERARASLRQALTQLRHVLGVAALVSDGESLSLRCALTVDRENFEGAIAAGDNGRAIELYEGPFLSDLALSGGREFEDWADHQRESLRASFHRALEGQVQSHLDRADSRAAKVLAYRLRNDAPLRERSWRLLFEALMSARELGAAQAEADALERLFVQLDNTPEPATQEVLLRVRRAVQAGETAHATELRSDLVGRDSEFSLLVKHWKAASSGRFQHVAVVAPAGFGKTRLLEDFRARLRSHRGRVASVRAYPGEREISHSLSSEIARSLIRFRGASAISPLSARALISIEPSIAETFPEGVTTSRLVTPPGMVELVTAFCDLLDAVSTEVTTTLLIDDLHWADDASRQLLQSILSRLSGESLLVVTASRNPADNPVAVDRTEQVSMSALTADDVTTLVAGIATLPEAEWMDQLVTALRETSAGSPYVVLDSLARLLTRGVLRISGGAFACDDVSALAEHVASDVGGARHLRELAPIDADVLLTMSVAGIPLSTDLLTCCVSEERGSLEQRLLQLSAKRLATPTGNRWRVAHDMIRETLFTGTAAGMVKAAHGRIGRAIRQLHSSDEQWLRPMAYHLLLAGDLESLRSVFHDTVTAARRRGSSIRPDAVARSLLGDSADPAVIESLVASLPHRLRQTTSRWIQVTAATLLAAVGLYTGLTYPTRLVAEERDWIVGPDLVAGGKLVFPTPVVELRNAVGGLVESSGDTIIARAINPVVQVTGDTAIPVVGGRASFPRLGVAGPSDSIRGLAFFARRHARSDTINLTTASTLLLFRGARINGVTLKHAADTIRVHRNETIVGMVETSYRSSFGAATVVMAISPTWGEPSKSGKLAGYLLANAGTRIRQDSVDFVAPSKTGVFFIILAYGPETDERYVLSASNWTLGTPRWDDGNDLAAWSVERLSRAARIGQDSAWIPALRDGREEHRWQYYGITGVTVLVR